MSRHFSTPKKGSGRRWKRAFLAALAKTGNVAEAARAARIHRSTGYKARHDDPEFSAEWGDAIEDAVDNLESEARRRAMAGSDVLLIFLLKAMRPEKYRERYEVKNAGEVSVSVRVIEEIVYSREGALNGVQPNDKQQAKPSKSGQVISE